MTKTTKKLIKKAIIDLEKNQDLELKTPIDKVVNYLHEKTSKKPTISIIAEGKNFPIDKSTWELLGKLFNVKTVEQKPTYEELRAYKGIGKTGMPFTILKESINN